MTPHDPYAEAFKAQAVRRAAEAARTIQAMGELAARVAGSAKAFSGPHLSLCWTNPTDTGAGPNRGV